MSKNLEVGFIGLGRMGMNIVKRMLLSKDIDVHAWNRTQEKVDEVVKLGAKGHKTVKELVDSLKQERRIVWLMLPSGETTENAFNEVISYLKKGDIIVDGANSNFHDSIRRHKAASERGIGMLDVGVSGGVVAAERGYAMMAGGKKDVFEYCEPILRASCQKDGYALVGEEGGSGHYVKMIHNAIEYGMMQAIGEGFDLLKNGRLKDLDLYKISHLWNHGTIVQSFLMEMTENALKKDPKLGYLKPYIADSGEGRWASIEAMEHSVPFVVNTYALHARYISRDDNSFAFRMLAAQRNEFGGHEIKK